jgi:hypothetical protein
MDFRMTSVSPSPRDLVARLSDNERVAIDLILQAGSSDPAMNAEHRRMYPLAKLDGDADRLLSDLVPDEKRRGYLKTLAVQLKGLGISVFECASHDGERVSWEEAKQRWEREVAEARAHHAPNSIIDEEV